MELDAAAKAKIAVLNKEMDAIHYANNLYWIQMAPTLAARAEHQLRQDRLEQIRAERSQLRANSVSDDTMQTSAKIAKAKIELQNTQSALNRCAVPHPRSDRNSD